MGFRTSPRIDELAAECPEASLLADSSCTAGYDNDGSTGLEIFENGYELAVKAAGRDVWRTEDPDGLVLFFIGTEDEVLAKLSADMPEDN